ncbi:MAG: DUF4350 domain-containing protein [Flavobacteriales bacterium]|nr:DUF4350 domain-containing protein [Flavobacteriales bacterium]
MHRLLILLLVCTSVSTHAQQVADDNYNPPLQQPAYDKGKGPVVFIDEGHHNFHTRQGRYAPFAKLLERDGYVVKSYSGTFNLSALTKGEILVISNALHESNVANWVLPTPSAFTENEIDEVVRWVEQGGSLFLIADHMPMAGAASDLALAFGFESANGFVFHDHTEGLGCFNIAAGNLVPGPFTEGRDSTMRVDHVVTFTGQAFRIPDEAHSVIQLDSAYTCLLPDTAWVFNDDTHSLNMQRWSQCAYRDFGKGRVVVCGEAAMFSAQLAGAELMKIGMNDPEADHNYRFLLNIIHWLDADMGY